MDTLANTNENTNNKNRPLHALIIRGVSNLESHTNLIKYISHIAAFIISMTAELEYQ